ncbi:MAG: CopD family protein [Bacteroidota bacterium]
MIEYYGYIKALHLIFVVAWFVALFYLPRLLIYQIEAFHKPSPEKEILGKQLKIMARRLWFIIGWPSSVLATLFAVLLLIANPTLLQLGWMHVKLGFVVLLILYHLKTHQMYKQLQRDDVRYTSKFMRLWNEAATLILFAVIFLVILKSSFNWIFGVIGIFVLGILLMLGFKLYERIRAKNPEA